MPALAIEVECAEVRFRAMGTSCHVLVTGPGGSGLVDQAVADIDQLERRWSRFRRESEVSRLNAALARPGASAQSVSPETLDLCLRAAMAAQATEGAWNPLVGAAIVAAGYDRSFDDLSPNPTAAVATPPVDTFCVDADAGTVWFPPTGALDVGGIAKGLTADLVSAALMHAGAWGVMLNMGGDLRVRGLPPRGLEWAIAVREPALTDEPLTMLRLSEGAVATSTTLRRRWHDGDGNERHHLINPITGHPADGPVVLTTAVAGEAWWAEVAATALTVRPNLELVGCSTLQVMDSGAERRRGIEVYES